MKRKASTSVILVLALSALLLGCSGSDSSPELTKAEFIKQADAICRGVNPKQVARFKAYSKAHPDALTEKSEAGPLQLVIVLPPIESAIEEISDLNPPKAQEGQIEEIIEGWEEAVAKAEADPLSLTKSPGTPFEGIRKVAGNFGFRGCAEIL